jgi:hypothetical protein
LDFSGWLGQTVKEFALLAGGVDAEALLFDTCKVSIAETHLGS